MRINPMGDQGFQHHSDDRYGIQGREDNEFIRKDDHGSPVSGDSVCYSQQARSVPDLPDQIRHPMNRTNRPLQECPQLNPQAVDTPLRWIHSLAVQAAVSVDPVMAMTFGTQHVRSVAAGRRSAYSALGVCVFPIFEGDNATSFPLKIDRGVPGGCIVSLWDGQKLEADCSCCCHHVG